MMELHPRPVAESVTVSSRQQRKPSRKARRAVPSSRRLRPDCPIPETVAVTESVAVTVTVAVQTVRISVLMVR